MSSEELATTCLIDFTLQRDSKRLVRIPSRVAWDECKVQSCDRELFHRDRSSPRQLQLDNDSGRATNRSPAGARVGGAAALQCATQSRRVGGLRARLSLRLTRASC
ncbi:hypothetical protein CEXT_382651 [Caerostris extrusa]|uniref:Uncharacterized protein n=1 Tax=Caerostris extrusa TaxID=172846 RepID=A0AAV4Q601_CAEEX|nr:hypothetical protein CEXT_382651 [Caerostris extrusa]